MMLTKPQLCVESAAAVMTKIALLRAGLMASFMRTGVELRKALEVGLILGRWFKQPVVRIGML